MKISFNSPFILWYTMISLVVLILDQTVFRGLSRFLFTVGPAGSFQFTDPLDYFRLVSHGIGHADFAHYFGNFTMILMIGPYLEEKFGTKDLLSIVLVTLLVTGILNVIFFPNGLLGASGVVYAFILLGSFAGAKPNTIPLTFILVALLFMGEELIRLFGPADGVSHTAHLLGGVMGSFFGFLGQKINARASTTV